jgi:hypothetical protein
MAGAGHDGTDGHVREDPDPPQTGPVHSRRFADMSGSRTLPSPGDAPGNLGYRVTDRMDVGDGTRRMLAGTFVGRVTPRAGAGALGR